MIHVTVFRDSTGYRGYEARGHADYAESGYDISCSAVSVLTINTANAIEKLTGDEIRDEERDGWIRCRFPSGLSKEGTLLMDAMLLGLGQVAETVQEETGKPFVKLEIEEVKSC